MSWDSVKYLHDISLSQLTPVEKTEIKNSGRAIPDLVTDQSSSDRTQTYTRKLNPDKHAEH
jgi:hypothetical protein